MANEKQATQTNYEFPGVRVEVSTSLGFDEVLARLHAQTGKTGIPTINEIASAATTAKQFEDEVTKRYVGASDFMVFAEIEHTRWIRIYGLKQRVLRIILGNPLIAITMLREDISAGLFAPVEMLLVEEGTGTRVTYVLPSTLIVVKENASLKDAAVALDHKLEALVAEMTELKKPAQL